MLEQTGEMRQHSGPYFQDWRRKVARSVGAIVVDDLPPEQ